MIRCFISINLPDQLKKDLDNYISILRPLAPKVKWVKARSLHITLKFLGAVHSEKLEEIKSRLSEYHRQTGS